MKKSVTRLKKSKFIRNIAILMSGTAIGQGMMVAAAPILSRIYDPTDFGVLGLFTALVSIISVIACWRYELAIVLPKEDEDAANVLALACLIVLFMTGITAILVLLGRSWIAEQLGSSELGSYLWWLPISILGAGLYQALNYWSTRRKKFKQLSISRIFRSFGTVGVQLPVGLMKVGASGLVGGQVAGQAIATVVLGYQTWRNEKSFIYKAISKTKIKKIFIENNEFPIYGSPQALLNSISQNIPLFMLAYFFTPEIVGLYTLAHRLLSVPLGLISQSFKQVIYQKISETYNKEGHVYEVVLKATVGLAAVGFIPMLIITFAGPKIFSLILGEEWYFSGVYSQWLIIWMFLGFINTPTFVTAQVFKLQSFILVYEIFLIIFRSAAFIVTGLYFDSVASIAVYSVIGTTFNIVLIVTVLFYLRNYQQLNR
ncbi:lipopolysaccharide biosynthesis protein [Heliorestis convoluta]|uniref:Polysaccharide biosynthesis family protein n=1 Tax=Heliorestis convoluta TaxID=356322 RepID=A0A5Q2MX94_9FIRM|nr:oligosaccharide flippase family protein [Heliorestis convoluta]QGG47198.1 polysaccharide biosynthesis family protein [Heliorestis convoluta]